MVVRQMPREMVATTRALEMVISPPGRKTPKMSTSTGSPDLITSQRVIEVVIRVSCVSRVSAPVDIPTWTKVVRYCMKVTLVGLNELIEILSQFMKQTPKAKKKHATKSTVTIRIG